MNKLKEILSNKKLVFGILGGTIGFIILIIVIMLIIQLVNRKMSYSALEDQLISATESYMKDHKEYYPTSEMPKFVLDANTLVTEEYIKKDISKLVKDNCTAEIEVIYENNAYHVKPFLTCDNYETQLFYDKILADNAVVNSGNGLYDMNEMLVFRGDQTNNYVQFHNLLWRIVKMDPTDSTIYLILENLKDAPLAIWDNRYNTTEESNHGINDFSVSVVSDTLDNIYRTTFADDDRSVMVPMNICIGKRSEAENVNDGSVECSNTMLEQKFVTLLPLYDYINASTDHQCDNATKRACANYNYLVNKTGKWWTLTADGSKGTKVFGINYAGVISSDYTDSKKYIRYVIAIDGSNIYSQGNGTIDSPYVMK